MTMPKPGTRSSSSFDKEPEQKTQKKRIMSVNGYDCDEGQIKFATDVMKSRGNKVTQADVLHEMILDYFDKHGIPYE